jgi:outer membrane protein assembly factor BamB
VFSAGVGWDWPVKSPTIADDGTIYFGSSNGTLYALSSNGTVKWSFNGCVGDPNGRPTPILSLDGTIYVCNVYWLNSSLYALYPMNGSIKWRVNLAEEFIRLTDLVVSADGTIYFGIDYETDQKETEIIALNSNGTEKWRIPFSYYYVHGSLAIAEDGVIYLGTTEHESNSAGYLHAFGPCVMKKIEIIQPKLGHFYFFGQDLGVTKHGHTIVIGDIDIKLNMYDEQNITSVTYTLNNINNSYSYTATQPPFDWTMNKRYSRSIVYHIYVVAVADFQGGCQWTDGMLGFWYIHFLKN